MKKENIMIPFESEQLAALDFSLKKKNTSVQAQMEKHCRNSMRQKCRSRCGSIWTAKLSLHPNPRAPLSRLHPSRRAASRSLRQSQ